MAEKRGRKLVSGPFVAGAAAMSEAMLAPANPAGLVTDAAVPKPVPPIDKIADAVAPAAPKPEPVPAPWIKPEPEIAAPEPAPAIAAAPEVAVALPTAPVDPAPLIAAVEAIVDKLEVASTVIPNPAMFTMASPLLKGFMKMATSPETTYAAADKIQSMFGDVNERAKTAVEKSSKMAEEMTELTKGNVEAFVASGRVAAKGAESMTQDAAEFGKKSFESATGAFKSFAAVKSPTELFQLQSEYAKTSFDSMVAEASKLSESMLKLMGEIAQPLSSRYAVAAEKIKSATAL